MHGEEKKKKRKECSGCWASSLLFFLGDQPAVQVKMEKVAASTWNPNSYWWPLGRWAGTQLLWNARSPAQVENCFL